MWTFYLSATLEPILAWLGALCSRLPIRGHLELRHVTTPSVWVLSRRHQLIGHIGWVWSVAWSSDGASLVSGSGDCTTRKWDAQTGDCRFVGDTPNKVYAVSPNLTAGASFHMVKTLYAFGTIDR